MTRRTGPVFPAMTSRFQPIEFFSIVSTASPAIPLPADF
jgi:hypothetical protein